MFIVLLLVNMNIIWCNILFWHCEPKYLEISAQQVRRQLIGDEEMGRDILDLCMRRIVQLEDSMSTGNLGSTPWHHFFQSDVTVRKQITFHFDHPKQYHAAFVFCTTNISDVVSCVCHMRDTINGVSLCDQPVCRRAHQIQCPKLQHGESYCYFDVAL